MGGGGEDLLLLTSELLLLRLKLLLLHLKLFLRVHQPPLHRLHLRQLRVAPERLVPQALPLRAPLVALLAQPPHLPGS